MKRKDNKAQAFLKKYQLGGFNVDDTLMQNPYDFAPDLQTAQQQQLVQFNQPKNQQAYIPQQSQQPQGFGWDSAIPLISPAINLGIGVKSIIDSFGERKRQKQYERAYKRDLTRRMDESRANDFYHTPYEYQYQNGGLYQPNKLDYFIDFYNNKEDQNKLTQEAFQKHYDQKNQFLESRWREKQRSGIQNTLSGAIDITKTLMGMPSFQEGGFTKQEDKNYKALLSKDPYPSDTVDAEKTKEFLKLSKGNSSLIKDYYKILAGANPEKTSPIRTKRFYKSDREKQEGGEYNPKTDLYSPEYDPNEFLQNELEAAQIEDKEMSAIENWLFQDEPELDEINIDYFNPEQTNTTGSSSDVISNIEALESGGNPEAINPTTNATGLFQFVPKYWAGQIKSFMGLPQTFTQEQVMQAFKKNEKVQRDFMNYVVNDIYMPEVEKLRPLAKKYGIDDNKLIKLLHYRGLSDAKRRLQTGDFTVSAEEKAKYGNPEILDYLNK